MKITILGNGAFGSALETYLARLRHSVSVNAVNDSDIIFVCVPAPVVIEVLLKVKKEITNQKIIICSKGFAGEGKLLSEVLKEKFKNDFFFLYGPVLAEEFKRGEFSSMVLAGKESKEILKKELQSERLRLELSEDIVGVEISAALKNVITMFLGMAQGVGSGQNTQAYLFVKGVGEIKNFGLALGAKPDTFLGLTCVGDITLLSRNRRLGLELGQGKKLEDVISEMKHKPEGILSLKNAKIIADNRGIKAPLIQLIYKIIFENYPIKDAIEGIK